MKILIRILISQEMNKSLILLHLINLITTRTQAVPQMQIIHKIKNNKTTRRKTNQKKRRKIKDLMVVKLSRIMTTPNSQKTDNNRITSPRLPAKRRKKQRLRPLSKRRKNDATIYTKTVCSQPQLSIRQKVT